jgi:hypothetical protein
MIDWSAVLADERAHEMITAAAFDRKPLIRDLTDGAHHTLRSARKAWKTDVVPLVDRRLPALERLPHGRMRDGTINYFIGVPS